MNDNIWQWTKDSYRVHVETKELYDELISWTQSKLGTIYEDLTTGIVVGYDVTISKKNLKRAEQLLSNNNRISPNPKNNKNNPVELQRLRVS